MKVLKFLKRVFVLFSVGYFIGHLITIVSGLLLNDDYSPGSVYILAAFFTIAALVTELLKKKPIQATQ